VFERIGICTAATTTTITCMVATSGGGAGSGALVCIYTVCALYIATTKAIGVVFAPTGTCGVATIITDDLVGSGAGLDALAGIYTACASCGVGPVQNGCEFGRIGTCGVAITTIITCMAATVGHGAGSGALVCTSTVFARSTEIIKAIGVACALTGTCGAATTTTEGLAGSGADGVGSTATCIGCAFSGAGLVLAG